MPQREVNNAAVENVLWEACQRLRNDEVGKKLWSFMKRTWLTALSELKRDPEAPSSPEERRARFAKAFISDTLWRLYQSTESGVLEISSEDAEFLFGHVLCRPKIFPEEAGGSLPPPQKPWKLILDVVEDTFLEVTDAKEKDHGAGPKAPKRRPPSKKPPGKTGAPKSRPSSAPAQDVPFWYRKLMGMEEERRSEATARPGPPRSPPRPGPGHPAPFSRRHRSPERWDQGSQCSWPRWNSGPGRPFGRSRTPRGGPTNALARHVHIPPLRTQSAPHGDRGPPGWRRSGSRRRRGGRRQRERRRGESRHSRSWDGRGAHSERRVRRSSRQKDTSAPSRPRRKRSREVILGQGRQESPGLSRRVKSERRGRSRRSCEREASKTEGREASAPSSACSTPRAPAKGGASSAAGSGRERSAEPGEPGESAAKEESQGDEAEAEEKEAEEKEEEGKSSSSAEESEDEKAAEEDRKETASPAEEDEEEKEEEEEEEPSGGILLTEAKAEADDEEATGGICLTEAKDVRRTPEEDADMFDDLDDVGLMAQLQGRLKEDRLSADGLAAANGAKEEVSSQTHMECANVAKGICLSKEAPHCKTPFHVSDRGGIFAGSFCQTCSEILVCGWGEDRKKLDL